MIDLHQSSNFIESNSLAIYADKIKRDDNPKYYNLSPRAISLKKMIAKDMSSNQDEISFTFLWQSCPKI